MKRAIAGIMLFFAILGCYEVQAAEPRRTATLIDKTGVISEVADLRFSGKLQQFENSWGKIALSAKSFDIAIPINCIVSIEAKGDNHIIGYLWRGKEVLINGTLFAGEFTGKSDFGDLKLHSTKLKSLKFGQAPKSTERIKIRNRSTLSLADGTKVNVDNLKRYDSYYSSEGYLIGGSTRYHRYTDFRFLRGASLATVTFDKIKRINFIGEKDVAVVLNNGKEANGTISSEKGADIKGWTGVFEKGEIFLSKKQVKIIEFTAFSEKP